MWREVTAEHADLDAGQLVTLELACRQRDRADMLAVRVAGGDDDGGTLRHERECSLAVSRLLAAMRLPDEVTGKRPQRRQLRGVQQPGSVSSLDRARQAAGG